MEDHGLLFDAFVFLTAAVLVVPLAKKSGLGSVLGYLIAGVAVGPFGMGLISEPQSILHFAEFGVVMMLFLIGLELKPSTLWRLRKPILGLGGAQVMITTAVFTTLALIFGYSWQIGLTIGMGLALSSTAIALQTLNEKHQLKTEAGQSSFAVLLFQDIAVIPMLAIVPLLVIGGAAAEGDDGLPWLETLKVAASVIGIIVAGRFLLRPVFRFIASTGIREIFTATALLIVIGIALLMEAVGLSAALGTFIAGVVLAESEYRHELETDIEPFKGLLLGLFFISVGMSVDFAILAEHPGAILAMVITLVLVKLLIIAGLGKLFKLDNSQNVMFSFVLAQGGEFAFVLYQFAATEKALPTELAGVLTVVVALSMVITPLLMILNDFVIQPRFAGRGETREADDIDDGETPVIIAGYGRFGQMIGRLLNANGYLTTVLDHDPGHIDMVRKFGNKVFYGDASRLDLLETAGAHSAKLFILAIDDVEKSLETAQLVKQHFPALTILARARNRRHAYGLMDLGVEVLRRETIDSSLMLGQEALVRLGFRAHQAHRAVKQFITHDEQILREGAKILEDEKALITHAKQAREDLEALMKRDHKSFADKQNDGWDG